MEIALKIFTVLCLSSLTSCLRIFPPLGLKSPVNLNINAAPLGDIFGIHSKFVKPNNPSPSESDQCFCFPNNSINGLVTNNLGATRENLERLVVYFYKNNGALQAFIPNAMKQMMIPDLNFDKNDGDVLKPVFSETVAEVFDSSPATVLKEQSTQFDMETDESETTNEETDIQEEVLSVETMKPGEVELEVDTDTTEKETQSIEIDVSSNYLTPTVDNIELQTADNNEYNHQVVSSGGQSSEQAEVPTLPNGENLENLRQIIAFLPPNTRAYFEAQIPKLQINWDQNSESSNQYLTFNKWFKNQFKGMIIHNLGTASKMDALKERIIKVLRANGMIVSENGMLFDSQGNLIRMSNIRLRPILIGDPVVKPQEISYLQVILITQVEPANILGVVPIGRVQLPNNIIEKVQTRSGLTLAIPAVGCKNCITRYPPIITSQSTINAIPYFQIPFNQIGSKEGDASLRQMLMKSQGVKIPSVGQPQRRFEEGGNIFQTIFGIPRRLAEHTRRFISGGLQNLRNVPKPSLDQLPGFRIIGGQPATSSGTPLVSKGRSGLEKPDWM